MLFETQHRIVKQIAAAVEAFPWGGVSTSSEKSRVSSVAMSDTSLCCAVNVGAPGNIGRGRRVPPTATVSSATQQQQLGQQKQE
ncbi:hypothetical protein DPMN_050215 [Dreissena polymorpha]|uniref:Uncharacterized protein n=1 Tax=Dreissena polymorpha TaxID=45954 RepID=A0A9D4CFP5_DREPO|nr:hypothetical protein DPMN_050215 [Dreissena polymorpha]